MMRALKAPLGARYRVGAVARHRLAQGERQSLKSGFDAVMVVLAALDVEVQGHARADREE